MSQIEVLGQFIDENCDVDRPNQAASSEIFQAYLDWCFECKHRPLNVRKFKAGMESLGYFHKRTNLVRVFMGVKLKQ